MAYQLVHESGETTRLFDGHILGDNNPLSFDDGTATVKSREVAENIARRHSKVTVAGEPPEEPNSNEGEESNAADESEDTTTETFICGVAKADGDPCQREVESDSATCWQH